MGMKVAAVSIMCQDQRVFDAMLMAGTPCPYLGKIGVEAAKGWEENPDQVPEAKEGKEDNDFAETTLLGSIGLIALYLLF